MTYKIIVSNWTTYPKFLRSHFPRVRKVFCLPPRTVEIFSRDKIEFKNPEFNREATVLKPIQPPQVEKTVEHVVLPAERKIEAITLDLTEKSKESEGQEVLKDPQESELPELKENVIKNRERSTKPHFSFFLSIFANIAIVLAIFIIGILLIPEVYYRLGHNQTKPIESNQEGTPLGGSFASGAWFREQLSLKDLPSVQTIFGSGNADSTGEVSQENQSADPSIQDQPQVEKPTRYIPEQDPTLPEGDWISIPRIGVRTEYQSTGDPEEAMQTGVWKAPDYGKPGQLNMPVIMAAHRFGWDWWWQTDYWRYHSFYLLPDTEPGDRVEIISDQRKWVYEIYAGEEGTDITDYDADLILYTCKFLTSPIRHFRYGRLIDVEANTQADVESITQGTIAYFDI